MVWELASEHECLSGEWWGQIDVMGVMCPVKFVTVFVVAGKLFLSYRPAKFEIG